MLRRGLAGERGTGARVHRGGVGCQGTSARAVEAGPLRGCAGLMPCRWVHTIGMRFPLDVAYVDRGRRHQDRPHGPPPVRVAGAQGGVGDRGRGRRVRTVGPVDRRRRRAARRAHADGRSRWVIVGREARPGRHADREPRRPVAAGARGPRRGGADLLRGHPAHRAAAPARRDHRRPDGDLQRAHRGGPGPRGARRAGRRRRRRRRHRRRHAGHQRPRRAAGAGGARRRLRRDDHPRPGGGASARSSSAACRRRGSCSRASCRAPDEPAPSGWPSWPRSAARSCCTKRRTACCARWPTSPPCSGADRAVGVARELTKLHETVARGTLGDVDLGAPRGEYVSSWRAPPTPSPPRTTPPCRPRCAPSWPPGALGATRRARRAAARRRPAAGLRPGDRRTSRGARDYPRRRPEPGVAPNPRSRGP